MRGRMWRCAPGDFPKVVSGRSGLAFGGFASDSLVKFDLDDPGKHVEVSSERFRKGLIWTIRGCMWRFALNDCVKVLSRRRTTRVSMSSFFLSGFVRVVSGRSRVA